MNPRFCGLVLGFLAILKPVVAAGDQPQSFIISNPGEALGETPVLVAVEDRFSEGNYEIKLGNSNEYSVAQIFKENGKTYFAAVLPSVAPGNRAFQLVPYNFARSVAGVSFTTQGPNVEIRVLGSPFTTLRTDLGPKPILYPLIGLENRRFTRDFPMKEVSGDDKDHVHHRSFWFTHGKVNGIDFWSEASGHGEIRQTSVSFPKSFCEAIGTVRTSDDWLAADGKKVCEDERVLRVYASQKTRTFDYEITIKASNGPVTFGDTKEGMLGMRLASSMDVTKKTGGKIINAEGVTDTKAWGKASGWVDCSGPIDDKIVGVAIFDHPSSFRHPTTWHVRDYGLFAANPFGWKDFGQKTPGDHTIPAGESITFKYRVILHEGDEKAAKIAVAYRSYATPLKVEVR